MSVTYQTTVARTGAKTTGIPVPDDVLEQLDGGRHRRAGHRVVEVDLTVAQGDAVGEAALAGVSIERRHRTYHCSGVSDRQS